MNFTPYGLLFLTISSIFQHIIILNVCLYLLRAEKSQATRPLAIATYVICWIPIYIMQLTNLSWVLLSAFFFVVIYAIVTKIVTHCTITVGALSFCYSYFLMMLSDLPFLFPFLALFPSEYLVKEGWCSLAIAVGGAVLMFIFIKYLPVQKIFDQLCKIPISVGYFFLLALAFLSILSDLYHELTHISPLLPAFLIILLIFSSTLLLIYQIFINQKNAHALYYYEQYLPILDNLIHKIREVQHGHNNVVQSLIHLSELDIDNEKMRSSLSTYATRLQKSVLPASFLQLENKLLAALLYYKYCQAEEADITIEFSISNPLCESYANEFELVDAVGILLDNAIESCTAGDTIYINIGQIDSTRKNRICIIVENPGPTVTSQFLHHIFSKGYTTKTVDTSEHGIGLHILQKLTKKYHGTIIVSNTTKQNNKQYICFELTL